MPIPREGVPRTDEADESEAALWSRVVGAVLIVVGGVWFLQGIDVLGGSSMTGNAFWAVVGVPMIVFGVVLIRSAPPRRVEPHE
jgi:predicted phage tail protein